MELSKLRNILDFTVKNKTNNLIWNRKKKKEILIDKQNNTKKVWYI